MRSELVLELEGGRRCPIRIGGGSLEELAGIWRPEWEEAALLGDARVLELHGERVASLLRPLVRGLVRLSFPAGEASKTRETKARIEDELLDAGVSRHACLVALGGGVSLDLGGFVAATYLRGIPFLGLPSSLLAQVDASIGGKTAVNTRHGKNLIGAFHQPAAVLIDPELLSTLPPAEWGNGLAEMVKHAVIADAGFFAWIEAHAEELARPGAIDPHALWRCVEIKAEAVQADEREHGRRAILNFGHTIGHAVEALDPAGGHGRAVAIGMRVESLAAREQLGLPGTERARLLRLLERLGLAERAPLGFDRLRPHLGLDKKRRGGALRLALPRALGEMEPSGGSFTVAVSEELLERCWERAWD
jgi:3-dehydroquinate synthase